MMINTDGVIFGDAVQVYFKSVFEKHEKLFRDLGINPKNGLKEIREKIAGLEQRDEIEKDIQSCFEERAALARAKDDVTNLEASNMVLVDESMARVARWATMEDMAGRARDTM